MTRFEKTTFAEEGGGTGLYYIPIILDDIAWKPIYEGGEEVA